MNCDKESKPQLKGYVYFVPTGKTMQVRWGNRAVSLTNESAVALVNDLIPLLDGTHTVDDLVSQLPWERKDITDVLTFLCTNKLLEDSVVSPFPPEQEKNLEDQILYFSQFSDNKYEMQKVISRTRVLVLGKGTLFTEVLSSLEKAGISPVAGDHSKKCESKQEVKTTITEAGADIVIVAVPTFFSPLFSWVNTVCVRNAIPWTSCTCYEDKGLVGPTVIPGQTPCYTCLQLRRRSNLVHYDEFIQFETYVREHPELQRSDGALIPVLSIVAHSCVLEVIKLVTSIGTVQTAGGQLSFDPLTMEMKVHPLLKIPRCPDCGLPSKETKTERVWMK